MYSERNAHLSGKNSTNNKFLTKDEVQYTNSPWYVLHEI